MNRLPLCLLLLLSLAWGEGDFRFRLQKRLPEARGVLENWYAGDGWDAYSRVRFESGFWGFTLMTDKARGEDWGDIVAGGVIWKPKGQAFSSISAGWLRADLGSGLVLAVPGSFSDIGELAMYKPPGMRNLVEPATSPSACRGRPLTGVGATFSLGGTDLAAIAAVSPIDSIGQGYHRTPGEIAGRGAWLEKLAAVRVTGGNLGFTAAGALEESDEGSDWFRAGVDWSVEWDSWTSTGEIALGRDDSSTDAAGWTSLALETGSFRSMIMVMRNPEGFPDERSSAPVSRTCDPGLAMGTRWRIAGGLVLKAGTGAWFQDQADLLTASAQLECRLPYGLQVISGMRGRTQEDVGQWRCWTGLQWKPHRLISIRAKVQFSGWRDSRADSTQSGSGMEIKLRYLPIEGVTLDAGGASCSTDGYDSRVYFSGAAFPGVFSSTALYGRTLALFMQFSAVLSQEMTLRAAVSWQRTDGAESLGSGWEETLGDSRTEFGLQLDCQLP